jgi:long-chain acyl-CoA synthetase
VNLLGFWALGARNLLIPNPRPLSNLKRAFENYRITWMSGVNTLFNGLSNEIWFLDTPPKHLKFASAGGMALQTAVAERWEEITGKPLLQGYGLTETSPGADLQPLGQDARGLHRRAGALDRSRCSAEDGQPGAPGRAGEIAARGPQVMKGYWNRPDETEKVMRGGWFLTGDIGVMDADGYFRIVDRKKDMVVVSGFNVYPNEIEDCLATHPGVWNPP